MNATEFAHFVKGLGFRAWVADSNYRGGYGFLSDDKGERVLSFEFTAEGKLSGNYGPPSRESGTGWVLNQTPYSLKTAEDVREALYAVPPTFCGKGWKHYTTVEQHLAMYGSSSKYKEV